ncbi:MAG: shikimate dehydrogenase [Gemmatimonadaceae bacterium]
MERPTRLVLLGHPVAHSLSPALQNAALQAAGIPLRYETVDVAPAELPSVVARLAAERAAGNVTLPHKEAFTALCATLTPVAERVGAVNAFWGEDGRLVGDNTDVGGFDAAARRLLDRELSGLTVALFGAGGSAAAVCEAVSAWPKSRLVVHARTRERAERLVERHAAIARTVAGEMDALVGADLLVNATPLGLEGSLMPIAPGSIPKHVAVLDLTYRRGRTPWAQACRARGLRADDGLPMLVEQGALSFARWFGITPDREAMWRAVRS